MPSWFQAYSNASHIVHVHVAEVDYGPATKLIPFLLSHKELGYSPQQDVVVVDDDVLYSPQMLAQYDCYSSIYPHAALGLWGCAVPEERFLSKDRDCIRGTELNSARAVDFLYGTASFRTKPSFFNFSRIADFSGTAPAEARYEDDFFFSGEMQRVGVPKLVLPIDRRQLVQFDTIWVERGSLINTNLQRREHFRRMNEWFVHVRHQHSVAQWRAAAEMSDCVGER